MFVEAEATLTIEIAFYFQVFWLFKITTKKLLGRVWWRTRESGSNNSSPPPMGHLWDTVTQIPIKSSATH